MVALSTCNGLWGILAFANGSALGIWPLEGGDRGRRHPHVLFRAAMAEDIGKCGIQTNGARLEEGGRNLHGRRRKRRRGEHQKSQKLFLDLALIADLDMVRMPPISPLKCA